MDVPPDGGARRGGRRASYETDRLQFIGRGRTVADAAGAWTTRAALRTARARCSTRSSRSAHRIVLEPERDGDASTSSPAWPKRARRRSALIEKYQDRHLADRVFELAWTHSQVVLRQLNATRSRCAAVRAARRLDHLRQPVAARRRRRHRAQPPRPVGLWGYGISGDLPIVLLQIGDRDEHRSRAPARAGARLLAAEGTRGRPGDLERGPRRSIGSCCRTRSWA